MARNRMIKVDFWADEKISSLSFGARLLFIGMWNFSDDSGVCRANQAYLKGNIFPYDASVSVVEIGEYIAELYASGRVLVKKHKEEEYCVIVNFLKHQTIKKPSRFRYLDGSEVLVAHQLPTSSPLVVPKRESKSKRESKRKGSNSTSSSHGFISEYSPLEVLFPDDEEIKYWLRSGSSKMHEEILKDYSESDLKREVKKAYEWQIENNKPRAAGVYLKNTWIPKSGIKKRPGRDEAEIALHKLLSF